MTDWFPWLGPDNDAPDSGWYISSSGMGRWAYYEDVAAYPEAAADAFEYGTGPLSRSRPRTGTHPGPWAGR
ncbi:hypothetical protein AB0E81_01860 [Streptomyces sp. NPDC033538]|uniref:hypothetical protein n=1 Tax=Streptomyces sp. NPDC033538 TaxID=3155367 RepID=UPI0033F91CE2